MNTKLTKDKAIKLSNEIVKKMNKYSCAKINSSNTDIIYTNIDANDNCRYDSYKKKNIIRLNIECPLDEFLRKLVHEFRHAQQNILYYEFYLNQKHIKDIHNDVEQWREVFENHDLYHELECSIEVDAYAYTCFFFKKYKEYSVFIDENNICNKNVLLVLNEITKYIC